MHVITITYTDYDGNKRTEDFYFNLNESEVIKWLTTTGDYTLDKVLLRLSNEHNGQKIIEIFEDFMRRSYGIKSLDGRKFIKNEEVWNDFYQTEAYSKIFSGIIKNAKSAADFINAIIPKDMSDAVAKAIAENPDAVSDIVQDYVSSSTKASAAPLTVPTVIM